MILPPVFGAGELVSKPRASGDDPEDHVAFGKLLA